MQSLEWETEFALSRAASERTKATAERTKAPMAKKRRLNTFDGMRLWFEGVGYLGTRPLLLLRHILPFTALTVCACVGTSLTLWVCALPLRLVGYRPSLDGLLRSTAVSALQTTQWLRPATSGGAFFAALDGRAPALAAELRAAPTVRGWGRRARVLLVELVVGCLVVSGVVFFSATWAPVVAATAAFVASGAAVAFPIAPLFVCVLATSCAAVAVALLWVPVIRPALKMFKAVAAFSKPLAAASFFLVLSGAVRAPTVELCAQAAWVYVLTFVQAKQFLYQYDARQDAAAWAQFTAEHRWALFGFGLPSWAATQYVHPLAGLLLLEANQGAAATFLAEALAGSVD